MKTQVELLKECCDIKDAACVRYQKRIAELEEENRKLREELSAYDREYFDEDKKAKNIFKEWTNWTIMVTDEHNRIILEKGEDGKRRSYWSGVVLC